MERIDKGRKVCVCVLCLTSLKLNHRQKSQRCAFIERILGTFFIIIDKCLNENVLTLIISWLRKIIIKLEHVLER